MVPVDRMKVRRDFFLCVDVKCVHTHTHTPVCPIFLGQLQLSVAVKPVIRSEVPTAFSPWAGPV